VLIYVPLIIPWPGLRESYSKVYRVGAAFLFESITLEGLIGFHLLNDGVEDDIGITFCSRDRTSPNGKPLTAEASISSFYTSYIYVAFTAALVLAGPIPWRRKGWAIVWAMILVHGLIVLKLTIWIIYGFSKEPISLIVLSRFSHQILAFGIVVVANNLSFGFIFCVFIWILVSFRRQDWFNVLPPHRPIRPSV